MCLICLIVIFFHVWFRSPWEHLEGLRVHRRNRRSAPVSWNLVRSIIFFGNEHPFLFVEDYRIVDTQLIGGQELLLKWVRRKDCFKHGYLSKRFSTSAIHPSCTPPCRTVAGVRQARSVDPASSKAVTVTCRERVNGSMNEYMTMFHILICSRCRQRVSCVF